MKTELILILLSSICWAITSLIMHNKFYFGPLYGFFGLDSWVRKYRFRYTGEGVLGIVFIDAPKTIYYKLFNIKYAEAFPGSATILTPLTDAMHLFQFLATKLIFLALALSLYDHWWDITKAFFIIWFVWGIGFSLTYRIAAKR